MKNLTLNLALLVAAFAPAAERQIVVAHRGASGYLPEHTLEAKAMAHAQGADFIEQDVVLTKDDVPVVLHDIHVDTVSDVAQRYPDRVRGDGRFYALDFTLAELRTLCFTERFNHKTGKPVYPKRFPLWKGDFRIATLEEDLELIAGLNHSTGRTAGVYPEIKQPKWHRDQGHDISSIVLPILRKHGYATKNDLCWVQCFEWAEVQRIRNELKWEGRLLQLLGNGKAKDGTDHDYFKTAEGIKHAAQVVDGMGPEIGAILKPDGSVTDFVAVAHQNKLQVHPYTLRVDQLPKGYDNVQAAMNALFGKAQVDGLFSDFPDVAVRYLDRASH
ncbi:MAG: glycerophosphodiester phosphodiesterase [Verrucomicrobiaceae bacterium]|nr:glycerophosphodiester phosphodiesterase [Verrucomicrobiaceae bacterium]